MIQIGVIFGLFIGIVNIRLVEGVHPRHGGGGGVENGGALRGGFWPRTNRHWLQLRFLTIAPIHVVTIVIIITFVTVEIGGVKIGRQIVSSIPVSHLSRRPRPRQLGPHRHGTLAPTIVSTSSRRVLFPQRPQLLLLLLHRLLLALGRHLRLRLGHVLLVFRRPVVCGPRHLDAEELPLLLLGFAVSSVLRGLRGRRRQGGIVPLPGGGGRRRPRAALRVRFPKVFGRRHLHRRRGVLQRAVHDRPHGASRCQHEGPLGLDVVPSRVVAQRAPTQDEVPRLFLLRLSFFIFGDGLAQHGGGGRRGRRGGERGSLTAAAAARILVARRDVIQPALHANRAPAAAGGREGRTGHGVVGEEAALRSFRRVVVIVGVEGDIIVAAGSGNAVDLQFVDGGRVGKHCFLLFPAPQLNELRC
mmetsp:Transcript_38236/g.81603  ORF Transcript_38236/g.81603 Transcript_38236/m.81603 type:complete len:415 (+) Transcript_38236:3066-4310(+)